MIEGVGRRSGEELESKASLWKMQSSCKGSQVKVDPEKIKLNHCGGREKRDMFIKISEK